MHRSRTSDTSERILVVGNPYVGDTVISVPFLRNLRRAFPDHAIDLLAEGRVPANLLHACPYLDAILPWERPAKRPVANRPMEVRGRGALPALMNAVACGTALRGRRYARAYLLKTSPSAAVLALRAGIPQRIGHAAALVRPFLTRAVPCVPGRHQIDGWLDLLAGDDGQIDDGRLELWPDTEELGRIDRLLAPLPVGRPRVFVAVTASDWRRQWPLGRWHEVIGRLVADFGCEIVLCGSDADRAAHAVLQTAGAGHVHDFSTAVPLREVAALMSRTDVFLGVESGLMHVAAACAVPTITIFDPRTEAMWRARGPADTTICGAPGVRKRSRWMQRRETPAAGGAAWLAGEVLATVPVAAVLDRVRTLLPMPASRPLPTLDLCTGRHRYALEVRSAGVPAAAVPATKPLAHAH